MKKSKKVLTINYKRIQREQKEHGRRTEFIQVDCFLLGELLEKHSIQYVNYLSIDTEGNKIETLKSIDYKKYKIDVIDIENNYDGRTLFNFLKSKGYKHVKTVGCDEII